MVFFQDELHNIFFIVKPSLSVAHIEDVVKLIDTKANPADNILWALKLRSRDLRRNLLFQNWFWFFFNGVVISTIWIMGDRQFPYFWPFTDSTYTFREMKVFSILPIIASTLLIVGLLSQFLVWLSAHYTYADGDDDDLEDGPVNLEVWLHQQEGCDGCESRKNSNRDPEKQTKAVRWEIYSGFMAWKPPLGHREPAKGISSHSPLFRTIIAWSWFFMT